MSDKFIKYKDFGLLLLRFGIGVMFILHGWGKLTGGPERWEALGGTMSFVGVTFAPAFFGFMAAFAEVFGGLFLLLGTFWRFSCFLLLCTMIVATAYHIGKGDPFPSLSHSIEAGILFLSLIFIGPGKYNLQSLIKKG